MINRFSYALLLMLIAFVSQSQEFNKKDFNVYRTKEGISNNHIFAIAQDAYGYIWVATERGLNRFDGSNFQQFFSDSSSGSLPQDLTHDLRWINKDELGVLTLGGLHIINAKTLEEYNLIIPADSLKNVSIVNKVLDATADKTGNIFVITLTGFYHFNNRKLIFRHDHFPRKEVETKFVQFGWSIVRAGENTLLLSTTEGLWVYDVTKKNLHPIGDKDDPFLQQVAVPKQKFMFIFKDEKYFSLIPNNKKEITFFDTRKKTKQIIYAPDSIRAALHPNSTIFRLNDSLMAITLAGKGFYLIRNRQPANSWAIDTTLFFENDFCTALLLDKNNRLWIGTINGLYKQNRPGGHIEQVLLPGESASLQKTISAFAVANNKLFTATSLEGLYVFSRDSLSFLKHLFTPEKDHSYITQLVRINEDSLMSARNAVVINTRDLTYKKIDLENITDPAKIMGVLFKDPRGRIYFTKRRGDSVYFKDPGDRNFSAMKFTALEKVGVPGQIAGDNEQNIWFGGQNGLIRLNNQLTNFDIFLDSFPAIKTHTKALTSNIIFDNNGNIFFGLSENGLIIYDIKAKKFSQIARAQGLPDNTIRTLCLYKNKTLWIGTESGLANYDLDSKKVSAFGASDGMPIDPSTCNILYYDSTFGHLYAGFTHTIVRFDPDELKKNQTPPDFFVESIDITGKGLLHHHNETITVPYKHNNVVINLAAINFEDASQQLFAYRLSSNDSEGWHEIGIQHKIFLTNLPIGKHKLQLKVYIRNQSWPDQIKEIIIIIKPPFWKTVWFYFLSFLLLAGVAYNLHRRRINSITQKANIDKQLAQTEMKALHSQMNPHFIFNCLNSIREMILNNENEQASLYLSKFARLIRITLNHSSKTFVSLEDTIDYLQRYLEMEQIRKSNFNYTIDVDTNLQRTEILLPPMLIQPFIENAIWHGAFPDKEMHLSISFKRNQHELICIVEDDGMGIETSLKNKEPELTYQSVGIANIRQRIQVLNEKYNLQSTVEINDKSNLKSMNARLPDGQGTGTIVTLHLTIKTNEAML